MTEPRSYAPQVQADATGTWAGNALRFATEEEAARWVSDLSLRWTAVRDVRVVKSSDPVTAKIVNDTLVHLD